LGILIWELLSGGEILFWGIITSPSEIQAKVMQGERLPTPSHWPEESCSTHGTMSVIFSEGLTITYDGKTLRMVSIQPVIKKILIYRVGVDPSRGMVNM
jgi:hypothetical protein